MTTSAPFTERLILAQQAIGTIRRDAVNPRFGSRYATLDAIIEQVRPALAANGLLLTQHVHADHVETRIADHDAEVVSRVPVCADLHDAQRYGAALTYARRYGIATLLCLATDDDDDANSAAPAEARFTPPPASAYAMPEVAAGQVTVHFGKNKGARLADLTDRQLDWYCDTWEPTPGPGYSTPSPADSALKTAALTWRAHRQGNPAAETAVAVAASEADGIPF